MLLNSSFFLLLFLPLSLFVYHVCLRKAGYKPQNFFLFLFSVIFCFFIGPLFGAVALAGAIINYMLARFLQNHKNKRVYIGAIIINILPFILLRLLPGAFAGYFIGQWLQPLCVAIFAFNSISMLSDIYHRRAVCEESFFANGIYFLFFPSMSAGPLLNYKSFIPQLGERKFSFARFGKGTCLFVLGLSKVLLIGRSLSAITTTAYTYAPNLSFAFGWFAAMCLVVQIYYELSGFSDMACGLAGMFGFSISANFKYPLICGSFTSFVSRFFYSLSKCFQRIWPSGEKTSKFSAYLSLFIFGILFSCFFHASLPSLIFGAVLGVLLIFEKAVNITAIRSKWLVIVRQIYFYLFLLCGFVFFGADTLPQAWNFLRTMFGLGSGMNFTSGMMFLKEYSFILLIAFACLFPFWKWLGQKLQSRGVLVSLLITAIYTLLLLLCIISLSVSNYLPIFA